MNSMTTEAVVVWADSTTGYDHPITEALDASRIKDVRVSIEMRQRSGDIGITPVFEYSDDGKTWDTAESFGSKQGSDGVTYGTSFESMAPTSGDRKRWIRFGVKAENDASTNLNLAYAILKLEMRSY